ncbi:hypothetical protein RU99_GL001681 [Enterococcus casseliflavus]|nr:hypothetical protein RU99_GL001681 [Enterococcus casseliflavus]
MLHKWCKKTVVTKLAPPLLVTIGQHVSNAKQVLVSVFS